MPRISLLNSADCGDGEPPYIPHQLWVFKGAGWGGLSKIPGQAKGSVLLILSDMFGCVSFFISIS